MRILIIGGTGLISTYITQQLLDKGNDVVVYNRGSRLYSTPPGVRIMLGDRTDYAGFETTMRDAHFFDVVIDMVVFRTDDAYSAVRSFSRRVGQYILCSSADVYRKPAKHYPVIETEEYGGLNEYSRNKIACEKIFIEAHKRGDLPLTIIRPAYTYGEGEGPIHTFGRDTYYIDRIRKGKPIIVPGDGCTLWSACHASDVAQAFTNAAGSSVANGKAYHTAGEEWMTWDTYHRKVAEALNCPEPKLVHIPTELMVKITGRAGKAFSTYQYHSIYDNSAAHTDLGFQYSIQWVEGVRRMASWLDEHNCVNPYESARYEDQLILFWKIILSAIDIPIFFKRLFKR